VDTPFTPPALPYRPIHAFHSAYQPLQRLVRCAQVLRKPEGGIEMARFTSENAAEYGRRGGQQSHQRLEAQYADLVLSNPSAAQRVAQLIHQGFRLTLALRTVRLVDQTHKGGK